MTDDPDAPRPRLLGQHPTLPAAREMLRAFDARAKPALKRAVPALLIALLGFGFGDHLASVGRSTAGRFAFLGVHVTLTSTQSTLVVLGLALVFLIAGVIATRSIGRELGRVSELRGGIAAGSAVRWICSIVGYLIVLLGLLTVLRVDLGNLLVGGAVTGVIIGIAAQQTLGNFFAGLVLLFARPYVPGQWVKIRTGAMGGPFDGQILDAGLMYTTIDTAEGPVSMPNSGLLAAAIGPSEEPATPERARLRKYRSR